MTQVLAWYSGCPMWANKSWVGSLFPRKTKPAEYLAQYARVFGSVEGNTTFYGIPKPETVAKWAAATPPHFRFTFKFPRLISHDMALRNTRDEVTRFLEALAPLHSRLGPLFLQLPPTFADFPALERFLVLLPTDHHYAVEARHPSFFEAFEVDFTAMLSDLKMDRVVFDTRALQAMESDDAAIVDAQRRKPKTPVRTAATGPHPFLRYVGRPIAEENLDDMKRWAGIVAGWLSEGRTPFVFLHQAPDDDDAPHLARIFHAELQKCLPQLPPMPDWPGEKEDPEPEQLSLF